MKQKHYHLYFILLALAFTGLGALMLCTVQQGKASTFVTLCLVGLLLLFALIRLANRVPLLVNRFMRSLRSGDYTVQFPQTTDRRLREMFDDMNQIITRYRESMRDIEYKQLYHDRLLRVMTHELRNAVTPILSLSGDILKRPEYYTEPRLRTGMEVIQGQCAHVKHFLDNYHQLTHLPQPKKSEVDVQQLFARLQTLWLHPSIHFTCGQGLTMQADTDLLALVLNNLIRNAREATEGIPDASIDVTASISDGEVFLSVSDNGPGIPVSQAAHIFLPFYTTKSSGTGIGLCLSRQIMRLHGGDLTLLDHGGRGTVFILSFSRQDRG